MVTQQLQKNFCDMCFEHNLVHIHGNTLDSVITNNDDLIDSISISPTDNLPFNSDHDTITFELSLVRPHLTEQIPQHVYNFSNRFFWNDCLNFKLFCLLLTHVKTTWHMINSLTVLQRHVDFHS